MPKDAELDRFIDAHGDHYARALLELRSGEKKTHWTWFIFPQLRGTGRGVVARQYAIGSIEEAKAFLIHPVLGHHYAECVEALQNLTGSDPAAILGVSDAAKLRASLTLFEAASGLPLFGAALDRWYAGVRDPRTIILLRAARSA